MTESTFVLMTLVRGTWRTQRNFDNRERAVAEAMRLANDPKCEGVKVTCETFDERQGAFVTRTLYRHSKSDPGKAELSAAEGKIRGFMSDRHSRRAI